MWNTARAIIVALSVFALVAGGTAAGDYPLPNAATGPGYTSVRTELEVLAGALSPPALRGADFAAAAAAALVRSALLSGAGLRESLESALPGPDAVLAMLALDRDVDDFLEASALPGPAGNHYRRAARLASLYRPLRPAYEAAYASAARELAGALEAGKAPWSGQNRLRDGKTGPALFPRSRFQRPSIPDMDYAHPYALDLFFESFDQDAEGQIGPPIPSVSGGIVVAAAADWRGGGGPGAWRGGGLSPAAGNGIVVYDPGKRLYVSYFHLRSLRVGTGDLVERGQVLGIGGNTGMNARKPDHGGHVHLEIFDARNNRGLGSAQILDFLDI